MRFYITSDNHGSLMKIREQRIELQLDQDCGLIILGDVGFNYHGDEQDNRIKNTANSFGFKIYCVRGNHEMRPEKVLGMKKIFDSNVNGPVYMEEQYPNIRYFTGEDIYIINNLKTVVINGAYSVDKYYRIAVGYKWFKDEQINMKEMYDCEKLFELYDVDLVLSHTCPYDFQPTHLFLPTLDQSSVDNSMEKWMNQFIKNDKWNYWLFGHYHSDEKITNGVYMLYHQIRPLEEVLAKAGKYHE